MRLPRQKFVAPACCLALLGGIAAQRATQVTAASAEPYHLAAARAIDAIPATFADASGVQWTSRDVPQPASAVALLRPNALVCRAYAPVAADPTQVHHDPPQLLVVQCKDSRDMQGHYPHNCYPNNGWTERSHELRTFDVQGPNGRGGTMQMTIPCTEYTFSTLDGARVRRWCVYNFLIVPGEGITPTIDNVVKAAEDYQQRHYGAAQYQVVCDADEPADEREQTFRALVGMTVKTIKVLESKG